MVTAILDICLLGHSEPDPVALHVELGVESATERRSNQPLQKYFLFLQALPDCIFAISNFMSQIIEALYRVTIHNGKNLLFTKFQQF